MAGFLTALEVDVVRGWLTVLDDLGLGAVVGGVVVGATVVGAAVVRVVVVRTLVDGTIEAFLAVPAKAFFTSSPELREDWDLCPAPAFHGLGANTGLLAEVPALGCAGFLVGPALPVGRETDGPGFVAVVVVVTTAAFVAVVAPVVTGAGVLEVVGSALAFPLSVEVVTVAGFLTTLGRRTTVAGAGLEVIVRALVDGATVPFRAVAAKGFFASSAELAEGFDL